MSWTYQAEVGSGLTKKQMELSFDAITFQGRSIPVDQVTAVCVEVVRNFTNGIPTTTNYKIDLHGPGGQSLRCAWAYASLAKTETKQRSEQAYRTLLDLVADKAGPRIVQYYLSQPMPAKFGPYTFSPAGIEASGLLSAKQAPWQAITGTSLNGGVHTVHFLNEQGKPKTLGALPLTEPNAYFFPAIFAGYRQICTQPQ